MKRRNVLTLFFAMLIGGAGCSAVGFDQLVATDRSQVDRDYAIQGEYLGEVIDKEDAEMPVGVQVIALGDGKFDMVCYPGGLPGAGWNKEEKYMKLTAEWADDEVVVLFKGAEVGWFEDDTITLHAPHFKTKPVVVKRVERKSPTLGRKAPEGATIVFGGKSADQVEGGRVNDDDCLWAGFTTKPKFDKPYTAHIEFLLPYMPSHRGQGRANSGCYFHDCYEVQVLDSFGLAGKDNECGGIYKVSEPNVNACLPPLQWQTYDVEFAPPVFEGGQKVKNARITVKHNGIVIHDNLELPHATPGRASEGPGPRPIHFQEHGNKVQYRNIWVHEKE